MRRAHDLDDLARACRLCPRQCGVPRQDGQGFCGQPPGARVAFMGPHRGEEPALTRGRGAGTVFLEGCSLRCGFCQNHQISHAPLGRGRIMDREELATAWLALQARGCANIEWVTPAPHLPELVAALALARRQGLHLPVVYNSSGYERVEVLRLLRGVVDLYMPDAKYSDGALARELSRAADYVPVNRRALLEMWSQAGPVRLDRQGRAVSGLLVRHMVLPGHLQNTRGVLSWLSRALGQGVWISVMSQYAPLWVARGAQPASLRRRLTRREQDLVLRMLEQEGLGLGWVQDRASWIHFLPDFAMPRPFACESTVDSRQSTVATGK